MKKFIADFHIHSKYSHATSKFMDLQALSLWGQLKGIGVMGTGDFTHPIWQEELKAQLQEMEFGLFGLKSAYVAQVDKHLYQSCKQEQRFLLSSEISTIFKRNGRCYRTHSILLAPSFQVVDQITKKLAKIGNLVHDGRPILGMDVKDLLKVILDASDQAMLIPAHIWTPWYGLLGSKSGFDSVQEAFGDMSGYIYALEKGLSSNFLMNAQLRELDKFTILANSDAHSLSNLGREANMMVAEMSYEGITQVLKNNDSVGSISGIEFFPERGKYYGDGHRSCNISWTPEQTKQNNGLCLVCGKSVTIGVCNRVQQLVDRTVAQAEVVKRHAYRIVPLLDLIQYDLQVAVGNKKIMMMYHQMLKQLGNEFHILLEASLANIEKFSTVGIARAIEKIRLGDVKVEQGYDGTYGKITFEK